MINGRVAELVYAHDSKSCGLTTVGVRLPPRPQNVNKDVLAYVIGIALGDGNLSNPNKRAVRLRVTCDNKYPNLIKRIIYSIRLLLPENRVSIIKGGKNFCNISCYSNKWEGWLGWYYDKGSKFNQRVSVPQWVKNNRKFSANCLRGLFETDGSFYIDRGYGMMNFVTIVDNLAEDVSYMINKLGFKCGVYKLKTRTKDRYNIRVSKNVIEFKKAIDFNKS